MEISIIKLTTGEEVIGQVNQVSTSPSGSYLELAHPCLVVFTEDRGNLKLTLYPTAIASKDRTVVLSPDAVVWTSEPSTETLNLYNQRFNKVVVPEKKLILS